MGHSFITARIAPGGVLHPGFGRVADELDAHASQKAVWPTPGVPTRIGSHSLLLYESTTIFQSPAVWRRYTAFRQRHHRLALRGQAQRQPRQHEVQWVWRDGIQQPPRLHLRQRRRGLDRLRAGLLYLLRDDAEGATLFRTEAYPFTRRLSRPGPLQGTRGHYDAVSIR